MIEILVGLFFFFFLGFIQRILNLETRDEETKTFIFEENKNNYDEQDFEE